MCESFEAKSGLRGQGRETHRERKREIGIGKGCKHREGVEGLVKALGAGADKKLHPKKYRHQPIQLPPPHLPPISSSSLQPSKNLGRTLFLPSNRFAQPGTENCSEQVCRSHTPIPTPTPNP